MHTHTHTDCLMHKHTQYIDNSILLLLRLRQRQTNTTHREHRANQPARAQQMHTKHDRARTQIPLAILLLRSYIFLLPRILLKKMYFRVVVLRCCCCCSDVAADLNMFLSSLSTTAASAILIIIFCIKSHKIEHRTHLHCDYFDLCDSATLNATSVYLYTHKYT